MKNKNLKNKFLERFYLKNYPQSWEKAFLKEAFRKGSMPPEFLYVVMCDERFHWWFDGREVWIDTASNRERSNN